MNDGGDAGPSSIHDPTPLSPPLLSLPLEIWSLIIYHLAHSSPFYPNVASALLNLAQVNQKLSQFALPHLYAHPRLDQQWKENRFWNTILAQPSRWWDVRSLLIGERRWAGPHGGASSGATSGWIRGGRSAGPSKASPKLDMLGQGIASAGRRKGKSYNGNSRPRDEAFKGSGAASDLVTDLSTSSPRDLPGSTWSKYLPSPPTNLQWAQTFRLPPSHLYVPIGAGPDPLLLAAVAWWEEGAVGGLLNGHAYFTRPIGQWCETVEREREERKIRDKAKEVEDVDLGRGPGTHSATARETSTGLTQVDESISTSRAFPQHGLVNISEEDIWAAAEMFAATASIVPITATASASAIRDIHGEPSAASTSSVRENGVSVSSSQSSYRSSSLSSSTSTTIGGASWSLPSSLPQTAPRRVPWRYRLVTGSLDPTLPKLFHALDTLTHIELVLYPGTLLDHDLLEHQLRLLLDPSHMPLLRQLLVIIGYDAVGSASRLARLTHAKTVRLAVERVDDRRCRCLTASRTFGSVGCKGSEKDVRDDIIESWSQVVDAGTSELENDHAIVPVVGNSWINGWLIRDVGETNDPIEE